MTTGTSPEPPDILRRWAFEQLELPPDAAPAACRRDLFRQLAETEFMPSADWDSALRVAGIAPGDDDPHSTCFLPARRAVEESLRKDVEAFAAKYFSLPPSVRYARFQELVARCAGVPAVSARLEELRPALDLPSELPTGLSPQVAALLDETSRLYVLPRQERASRRLAFLQECRKYLSQWQDPAKIVQRKFARYAALEPALFRELSIGYGREKLREKIARQRKQSLRQRRATTVVKQSSQRSPWWIGIAIVVVLNIVRGLTTNNHATKPVPPTYPRFNVEQANKEMKEQVNNALREGKPIPEAIRRLYGLPPQSGPLPGTPSSQPRVPLGSPNERPQLDVERFHKMLQQLEQDVPPKNAPSTSPGNSSSSRSAQRVEFRVAKSMAEANEMMRQPGNQRVQGDSPAMQAYPVGVINTDQARELLRQLRQQQSQAGADDLRDATIEALEKALEEAARSSR